MKCLLKYNFFHFILILLKLPIYPHCMSSYISLFISTPYVLYIFFSFFDHHPKLLLLFSKVLHIIFRCSTSQEDFFLSSDVNYTYSISIFLYSTDNTYFHFLVQFTFKKQPWKIIKICGYFTGIKNISNLRLAFFPSPSLVTRLAPSVHSTNQHLLSSAFSFRKFLQFPLLPLL